MSASFAAADTGILEAAHMVDEADALGVGARPDATLRDAIDILDALLAALADALQKFRISMIDRALQDLARIGA